MTEGDALGQAQHVPGNDAGGNERELRVGPVPEEKVVAQVLPPPRAEGARPAGRRVGHHHGRPGLEAPDAASHRLHHPRHLVAEHGGRGQHPRVVAAAEDLHVGPAGEGGPVAQDDLARARRGHLQVLDPHVLAPVEHGGAHGAAHPRLISTTTFRTPGAGRAAVARATLRLLEREAVGHQAPHVDLPLEDQPRREVLQLGGGAVGEQDVLLLGVLRAQVHLHRLSRRGRREDHDGPGRAGRLDRLGEGRPPHGREQHHVGPAPVREPPNLAHHVPRGRPRPPPPRAFGSSAGGRPGCRTR